MISCARIVVGLGTGWTEREFGAHGYEFGVVDEREEGLGDAARICDDMSSDSATYEGGCCTVRGALGAPRPIQIPRPPILFGGSGERRNLETSGFLSVAL